MGEREEARRPSFAGRWRLERSNLIFFKLRSLTFSSLLLFLILGGAYPSPRPPPRATPPLPGAWGHLCTNVVILAGLGPKAYYCHHCWGRGGPNCNKNHYF